MQQHQIIDHTITSRHSVRAFKNTPIDIQTIKDILTIACHAPSGNNIQPWKVYVVTGQKRKELIDAVCLAQRQVFKQPIEANIHQETFKYYPEKWTSPFIERRRENGWGLYGLLNIKKGELDKIQLQHLRNYQLFDAPVGLFFTSNTSLETGAKMDIAMMMQNVMLAAKAREIDSCPQAAWNPFHQIVANVLNIPEDEELICAIALGYADDSAVVNRFKTSRVAVEEFAIFCD